MLINNGMFEYRIRLGIHCRMSALLLPPVLCPGHTPISGVAQHPWQHCPIWDLGTGSLPSVPWSWRTSFKTHKCLLLTLGDGGLMARLKSLPRGFPGGPMVKNPPSNAGDTGSIPDQRNKILYVMGQLSSLATRKKSTCNNEDLEEPKKKKSLPSLQNSRVTGVPPASINIAHTSASRTPFLCMNPSPLLIVWAWVRHVMSLY